MMLWVKYLVTAAVVVAVSELARHSGRAGAFVASLPIVSLLVLIWLHLEHQPARKLTDHAFYTFWYVIPTLPMFLVFPKLMNRMGFWPTLGVCVVLTAACFGLTVLTAGLFGVNLIPSNDA